MINSGRYFMRERRKELGLTMKEIADKIGVQEATYQRYESGVVKNIPYDKITAIADILNCRPQDLLNNGKDEDNIILTDIEKKLIDDFRSLNEEGQEVVLNMIDGIIVTGKYKKSSENELGKKKA